MSAVQNIKVAPGEGDQRLDRWFRRSFPHISQGRIEKMCRKGDIRVDGGRVKPATRVQVGQTVRIPPLPDPEAITTGPQAPMADSDIQMIRDCVIYKDDYIIALNKPPGLATQGGTGVTRHVDGLAQALAFDYDEKPRLVHRLDKDTSGVLLLARTREVAKALTDGFRGRDARKIYWAIVAGVPHPRMGTVKWGLVKAPGHGPSGGGEKMMCIHPTEVQKTEGAKRAETDYAVIENLAQRASWVGLVPVTGRTHQLRAHMAEMGHPIVGDGKYGGTGQENLGDGWGAMLGGEISRKLHLHARSIEIDHPVTRKRLRVVAELPSHMAHTWDQLGFRVADAPDDPFEEEEWGA